MESDLGSHATAATAAALEQKHSPRKERGHQQGARYHAPNSSEAAPNETHGRALRCCCARVGTA